MKKNDNKPDNNRRKFLQGVASTGAGTAAVALMPVTVHASVGQHDVDKKKQDKEKVPLYSS